MAVIIIVVTGLSLAFGDTSGGFRRLLADFILKVLNGWFGSMKLMLAEAVVSFAPLSLGEERASLSKGGKTNVEYFSISFGCFTALEKGILALAIGTSLATADLGLGAAADT